MRIADLKTEEKECGIRKAERRDAHQENLRGEGPEIGICRGARRAPLSSSGNSVWEMRPEPRWVQGNSPLNECRADCGFKEKKG